MLYWQVGTRIRTEVLRDERAEYGKQIIELLSEQLTVEVGRGFGARNLFQMVRFAEVFGEPSILQTLSAKLSWSHFVEIIRLDDALKRDFCAEMCRVEGWSVRTLQDKINGMLFERTALSKKPDKLIEQEGHVDLRTYERRGKLADDEAKSMSTLNTMTTQQQLDAFNQFANEKLTQGEQLTLLDLFELWALHHPSPEEQNEVAAIIRQGDKDIAAGRHKSVDEVNEQLRQEFGFPTE